MWGKLFCFTMAPPQDAPIKDIILYHFPMTRSARIRWLLLELNIAHQVEKVDLWNGQHLENEYLSKNPNHNVPMLEFTVCRTGEKKTMLESGAMLIFLADIFSTPSGQKLAPPATEYMLRSDYLQMMLFGASWMDMMLWQVRMHTHLLPINQREQTVINYYKMKFKNEVEPQLRDRLIGKGNLKYNNQYMVGNQFTVVDILIGYNLMWANGYKMSQVRHIDSFFCIYSNLIFDPF